MKEINELLAAELDRVQTEIVEIQRQLKDIQIDTNMKGYICFKFITCGKSRCHCMKGGMEHGPYPHLQWWEKGKIKTKYLNKKNYPDYKAELEKHKTVNQLLKKLKDLQKTEKQLLRNAKK